MVRFVAACLLVLLPLSAARAESVTVPYWDLDLSKPGDVQILKERVLEAAESACAPARLPNYGVTPRMLYKARSEQRACVRQASDRALARILGRTGLA